MSADRELILLAATESLERFSYYGVRGILVLFLTASAAAGGMAWTAESALKLLGWFAAVVYVLPVIGGLLGDRMLGPRRAVWMGAAVLVAAYSVLTIAAVSRSESLLFASLVLIAVGTGLFKPNITALVGSQFDGNESGRERGFLIFYLFMNIGVVSCGFIVGTLGERVAWHYGFAAAAVAMASSVMLFVKSRSDGAVRRETRDAVAFTRSEWAGVKLIAILGVFATIFWMGLDQTAGLLNLFAFEHTLREVGSLTIPATWFQSLNPLFIIALAPGFAWLWTALAQKDKDPRTEWKFVLGLIATGGAFAVMSLAAGQPDGHLANPAWLVAAYLLLSIGELCIWTISLAAVTRLSPKGHTSLFVGLWYLAIAIGGWCAGQIGALVAHLSPSQVFALLATIFGVAALLLSAAVPFTARLHRPTFQS